MPAKLSIPVAQAIDRPAMTISWPRVPVVFGPINVRCQSVKLRGLDHGVRAERWHYPDGSYLLELSARCPVNEAAAVARRVSTALRAYGVTPADEQRLKTDMALQAA